MFNPKQKGLILFSESRVYIRLGKGIMELLLGSTCSTWLNPSVGHDRARFRRRWRNHVCVLFRTDSHPKWAAS